MSVFDEFVETNEATERLPSSLSQVAGQADTNLNRQNELLLNTVSPIKKFGDSFRERQDQELASLSYGLNPFTSEEQSASFVGEGLTAAALYATGAKAGAAVAEGVAKASLQGGVNLSRSLYNVGNKVTGKGHRLPTKTMAQTEMKRAQDIMTGVLNQTRVNRDTIKTGVGALTGQSASVLPDAYVEDSKGVKSADLKAFGTAFFSDVTGALPIEIGSAVRRGRKKRQAVDAFDNIDDTQAKELVLGSDDIANINKTSGQNQTAQQNGFIELQQGQTLADAEGQAGAFLNPNTNDFIINTKLLGTIKGKIVEHTNGENIMVVDQANSKITSKAKTLEFRDYSIFDNIKKSDISSNTAAPYTPGNTVRMDGSEVVAQDSTMKTLKDSGWSPIKGMDDEQASDFVNGEIDAHLNGNKSVLPDYIKEDIDNATFDDKGTVVTEDIKSESTNTRNAIIEGDGTKSDQANRLGAALNKGSKVGANAINDTINSMPELEMETVQGQDVIKDPVLRSIFKTKTVDVLDPQTKEVVGKSEKAYAMKGNFGDSIGRAVDIAIALLADNNGRLTQEDVQTIANKAAGIFMELEGIEPQAKQHGGTVDAVQRSIAHIAQGILDKSAAQRLTDTKQVDTSGKTPQNIYEMTDYTKSIYESLQKNDQGNTSSRDLNWSQLRNKLRPDKAPKIRSASKKGKSKNKAQGAGPRIKSLADKLSNVHYEKSEVFNSIVAQMNKMISDYQSGRDKAPLLQYLNDGADTDYLSTSNGLSTLEADIGSLIRMMDEVAVIDAIYKNKDIKFDSEIMASLRVRYSNEFNPQTNKMFRTLFPPKADVVDVKNITNAEKPMYMRLTLDMVDIKLNWKDLSDANKASLKSLGFNPTAGKDSYDVSYLTDEQVVWLWNSKAVRDKYRDLSGMSTLEQMMEARDMEGIHSMLGIKQFVDMINGRPTKIYGEIDGITNGHSIAETQAGIIYNPATAVGVDRRSGLDGYEQLLEDLKAELTRSGYHGPMVDQFVKTMKRVDVKAGFMAKGYAAGLQGVSEAFAGYVLSSIHKDAKKNLPLLKGLRALAESTKSDLGSIDFAEYKKLQQSLKDNIEIRRQAALENTPDVDFIKSLDVSITALREEIKSSENKAKGQISYLAGDLISGVEKLNKDSRDTLNDPVQANNRVIDENVLLTTEEIDAIKKTIANDIKPFIDATIENMFENPANNPSKYPDPTSRAYQDQDLRYHYKEAIARSTVVAEEAFFKKYANRYMNKRGVEKEINKIANIIHKSMKDPVVTEADIAYKINKAMKKTDLHSISDVVQGVLDAGYKLEDTFLEWDTLFKIAPKLRMHDGSYVSLLKLDANMGMVEVNGIKMNVPSIGVRLINDPTYSIGQDTGFMSAGFDGNQGHLLSILDAVFGGLNTYEAARKLNGAYADMAMNYNIYTELRNMVADVVEGSNIKTPEDYKFLMARNNTRIDTPPDAFMEAVDLYDTQEIVNDQNINTLDEDLSTRADVVTDIQKNAVDVPFTNYSNGDSTLSSTSSHDSLNASKIISPEARVTTQEINLDSYNDTQIIDKNLNFTDFIKFFNSHTVSKTFENIKLAFGTKTTYDGGTINLDSDVKNYKNIGRLFHEIAHSIKNGARIGKITQAIQDAHLVDKIKVVMVDKSDVTSPATSSKVHSFANVDEMMSNIAEVLEYNEALANNSTYFATILGDPNIGDLMGLQYVDINHDGQAIRLHTMSQFIDFMKGLKKDKELDTQLDNYHQQFISNTNGSIDIKNWLNGIEVPEMKYFNSKAAQIKQDFEAKHEKNLFKMSTEILKTSKLTGGLFSQTIEDEGMNAIADLAKRLDFTNSELLASETIEFNKLIDEDFKGLDPVTTNQSLGTLVDQGLQHLVDVINTTTNFKGFIEKLKNMNVTPDTSHSRKILGEYVGRIAMEHGVELSPAQTKKVITHLRSGVKTVSQGDGKKKIKTSLELSAYILNMVDGMVDSKVENKLSNSSTKVQEYATDLDQYVAVHRTLKNKGYIESIYNTLLVNSNTEFDQTTNKYIDQDSKYKQATLELLDVWKKREKYLKSNNLLTHQFGVNPNNKYKTRNYQLSWVGTEQNLAGYVRVGKEKVPVYYNRSKDLTVMNQDAALVDTKHTNFETGRSIISTPPAVKQKDGSFVTTINGKEITLDKEFSREGGQLDVELTPHQAMNAKLKNDSRKAMDTDFTTMYTRNTSLIESTKIKYESLGVQIKYGLETGILVTEQTYNDMDNKSEYDLLGDPRDENNERVDVDNDNDYIVKKYGRLYSKKVHSADMEGTKGMNIGKAIDHIAGAGASKYMIESARFIIGARDALKNIILLWSPGSWINSFTGSLSIYMVHATIGDMHKDKSEALKMMREHKELSRTYARQKLKGDPKAEDTKKLIEEHPVTTGMSHGLSSTIRSDTMSTRTMGNNQMYDVLDNTFGSGVTSHVKSFHLDPNSKIGNQIGQYYDMTEVLPKMMLYVNQTRKLQGDYHNAARYASLAFPQYSKNLSGVWNLVDQFSPYTKYFISWPSMMGFAYRQNTFKFLSVAIGMKLMFMATWLADQDGMDDEERRKMIDGYMKLPFDMSKYAGNMSNWSTPSKEFNGWSPAQLGFVPDNMYKLALPLSMPLTHTHSERETSVIDAFLPWK